MIPTRVLLNIRLHVRPLARPHKPDGSLQAFGEQHEVPPIHRMDRGSDFATWYLGWRPEGLSVGMKVHAWSGEFHCSDVKRFWNCDGLRLFVDTRDTKDLARATRFCQQFYVLPAGGGSAGDKPQAGRGKIARAKEEPPAVNTQLIDVGVQVAGSGYTLEAFLPAEVLPGYEPAQFDRLGIFLAANDRALGRQELSSGAEMEYWANPATWASCTLEPT